MTADQNKPMAITMGDPSGIGPEIIVKALAQCPATPALVFGCPKVLGRAVGIVGAEFDLQTISSAPEACFKSGILNVLCTGELDELSDFGRIEAKNGRAAFDAIKTAVDYASSNQVSAIVTAPIHKEALALSGIKYPGHTEILADLGNTEHVAMMLGNDEIRTVLVTIHCSLRDAIDAIGFDTQIAAIRLAHKGASELGFYTPRVAVAGLNPHAGEGGLFGREEIEIIAPAIKAAQAEGIDVTGPWPGDTVFMMARCGQFDVVVAQYHDQGLIPVKYMGLDKGVNITLGLPFIRTSPDHGTAFDIAGTGKADAASLLTSMAYASKLVAAKNKGSA